MKSAVCDKEYFFLIKTKSGITKIAVSKLEYCEVSNRKVVLHLATGEKYECNLKMSELEEKLLPFEMFFRPHRSFIINMDYIRTMTTNTILMECAIEIPIPREKYQQVKHTYMDYMLRSPEVILLENQEN
jgi:DNA-binding LytR/AlgR family response regulator